ncbi:hypothetical protein O6P43_007638 [Quillaja saponaria]|uniref:Uncharacterized protein n=1 Tax=Quillaja saponaria TaxID=32244 RepID=A0AAD7QB29_QUISA|nr:hypothetical protein O6P43_007638 [Quillaja saponaria]
MQPPEANQVDKALLRVISKWRSLGWWKLVLYLRVCICLISRWGFRNCYGFVDTLKLSYCPKASTYTI